MSKSTKRNEFAIHKASFYGFTEENPIAHLPVDWRVKVTGKRKFMEKVKVAFLNHDSESMPHGVCEAMVGVTPEEKMTLNIYNQDSQSRIQLHTDVRMRR